MDEAAPLTALWAARSVAVVGASDRAGSLGRLPVEFLTRFRYAGRILPVRPDGAPVAGHPSYPSVATCPGPVDLAMIMVGAANVLAAVEDCIAAEVPVAIVCTSGFAETGPEGAALQDEVTALARGGGLRIVGPNCIGSVGVGSGQVSSFSPLFGGGQTELRPGSVGFVSQSGALGYGAVSLAWERGLGLGWVVNTGNEADVSATEVIEVMAAEPGCTGILAYLESVAGVPALEALARVRASGVPVAVLKAGRSDAGAAAAASHTGAMATGDRVVDAALRSAGVVRVDDVDELLDVGEVFGQSGPGEGRIAVVTTSGGSGILAADAIEAHGLSLAALSAPTTADLDEIVPAFGSTANPVDVTATVMSDQTLFDRALTALCDDEGVDVILACFCVLTGRDVDAVVDGLTRVRERSGKPVVAVRTGADHLAPLAAERMRAAGIPCYPTPARAVGAIAALVRMHEPRPQPVPAPPLDPTPPTAEETESTLKARFASHGLPVPQGRFVSSAQDTSDAVAQCHGRAVLKAVVPGLHHKSDAGGVVLDVTADRAHTAYEQVAALGGEVWCEEQVARGVEVLVGVAPTPLGPMLTVGVGGVLTEVLEDVALRPLLVTPADVEEMLDETRLGRLLAGVRGAPPADRAALVDAVCRVAHLVATWPPGELDLNPVTVLEQGQGVRILDAVWVPSGLGEGH